MELEQTTATASSAAHTLDLIILVLQHLNHKQRARCAAVCRDWRVAAALVTRSVCISKCSQRKADSLCTWLQANASLAPVSSLELHPVNSQVQLRQLPWSQLQHLEVLKLGCIGVTGTTIPVRPATDWNLPFGGAAVPGLTAQHSKQPPVLQALTCLELTGPAVGLLGSIAAPKLHRLACLHGGKKAQLKGDDHVRAAAAFAKLLPQLQLLTSLEVSGTMCHTTGLGLVSSLQHLQQLKLHQTKATVPPQCSGRAFLQHLPASLTRLELDKCAFVRVTASVLSNLTALQVLQVQQAGAADWAALSCLVSLQRLVLTGTPALQGPQQRRKLEGFSCLTKLQHLELEAQGHAGMAQVPAADAAALTASSHLTALVLRPEFDLLPVDLPGGGLLGAGLQVLPDLVQLCTGVGLLAKPSAMQRLVHRCSSLRVLDLDPQPSVLKAFSLPHRDPAPTITPADLAVSLAALWELPGLQVLRLPSSICMRFSPAAWDALAGLSGLTELKVGYDGETAAEALQMTRLQPLQKLKKLYVVSCNTNLHWHFEVDAKSKAPDGKPSDLWWICAVDYINDAVGDLGYEGMGFYGGDYLQELQLKGQQLVQQLQSQLDHHPQQQEQEEEQQEQQEQQQQQPQGTAELPAEQRQQLVEAVAAINGAVQSIQSALDYMEEEAELNKQSPSEDSEDDYRGHRQDWGRCHPYW